MHGRGIVHRDLKLENILMTSLDESARIVVTDFGGARRIPPLSGDREDPTDVRSRRMFSAMGTLDFAAP
jgi:serine/threonine protein kinase